MAVGLLRSGDWPAARHIGRCAAPPANHRCDVGVLPFPREELRLLKLILHSELRRRAASRQRGSLTRWVSWCTAVFTVRHVGTSPTISLHPLMSLLGFVCVPQTDTSSSYLAVDSTHTAVGRFRLLVRRSGTRCLTISEIRRVVLTVLSSFLRQSCSCY